MNWHEQPHFAALDWARDHHDFVVIDRQGVVIEKLRFEHDEAGWRRLGLLVEKYRNLPVAVETSHGTVVENLFAAGVKVFPINPKAAERYRERHAPSGVKNDLRDAWSLADALRLDGHMWQPLRPLDPALNELRLLCRDEIALIEQRTQLVNQLRQALHEYYPVALSAFDDWTSPVAWAFVVRFPTPQALHSAGSRRWESFMRQQRVWRPTTVQARITLFAQATSFCGTPSTVAAKSLHAVSLAQLLQVLEKQLVTYREHIEAVFARHPDHALFGSLPGAGEKIAPRLLAEIGDDRVRFPSAQSLQCHAGTAPVTIQSGKMCYQRLRHACNMSLRYSVHIWADLSRRKCKWAEDYYRAHRAKGHTHATALRCLGQRWLNILWKMWQTGTSYDEALHTRNQSQHGSWVAKAASAKPA
jgi:transposase